jgi:hypothetical protein
LKSNRVQFLAKLKALGVEKLGDRQKVANSLARDRREGRVWLPGEEPPTPAVTASAKAATRPLVSVAAPIVDATSSQVLGGAGMRPPPSRRDAHAADLEADPVMVAIKARRASGAWQLARQLRTSPAGSILRARALVAMGSLASAMALYKEVMLSSSSAPDVSAGEAMDRSGGDDDQAATAPATAPAALSSSLAALAKAEATQLFALAQFHDALGAALHFFFPRKVPMSNPAPTAAATTASSGAVAPAAAGEGAPPPSLDGTYLSGFQDRNGTPIALGYRIWPMPRAATSASVDLPFQPLRVVSAALATECICAATTSICWRIDSATRFWTCSAHLSTTCLLRC